MFAHLLLSKQTFFTLKRNIWACHLYRNVFFKQIIGIKWKQILGVKMFPGDSEDERPRGLCRIWGVKACQGVEKDDGGVTSRFNCLHKTAHTLLTNGNISKRTCFCPFSFRFFMFSTAKLGEIVVHKQL